MNKFDEEKVTFHLGFCLSTHFAFIEDIDEILKNIISAFLSKFSGYWIRGTYWGSTTKYEIKDTSLFSEEFDIEINNAKILIEGIKTRVIGNILIQDASTIIENPNSDSYLITFKRIHDEYEILFFSFSNK